MEYIQGLQEKSYKTTKRPSIVINNFFSLITIIIISITIILYVNYIVPAQKAKKDAIVQKEKKGKFIKQRAKQIALSHKLNKNE